MQTILVVYGTGLVICILVGVVLSAVVFRDLNTVVSSAASRSSAVRLSRIIKFSFVLAALVGGISAKFYGCQYRYADLVDNPAALTMKVFGQIEGTLRWLLVFLLILAGIILTAVTIQIGSDKRPGR
ncbi:MAG: hypothetical protein JW765_11270 [Deltaproteobacteria bacterium]|nr:hypothetical protein [Candidatus Zymogenaceae bacterium]